MIKAIKKESNEIIKGRILGLLWKHVVLILLMLLMLVPAVVIVGIAGGISGSEEVIVNIVSTIVSAFIVALAYGFMYNNVMTLVNEDGEIPSVFKSISFSISYISKVFLLFLAIYIIVELCGTFALVAGALLEPLMVMLMFLIYDKECKDCGLIDILSKSVDLVKDKYFKVFRDLILIMLLAFAIAFFQSLMLGGVCYLLIFMGISLQPVMFVSVIISAIINIGFQYRVLIGHYKYYLELKESKELLKEE